MRQLLPHMAEHIRRMEILGSLSNDEGMPVELDTLVYDDAGNEYAFTVMTLKRFEEAAAEPGNFENENEEDNPRVFVLNEEYVAMDSLAELLKSPKIEVFKPYLYKLEDE